ncbi:transcriptional regulator [Azospirillum sp. TSH100]|uniref:PTS sugar transporter subunit IIA n=1 Tax=Azospirillum sp. TSH100 TaxID=652764 RepID=UPI000D60E83B|nr:PTS sugar transporter subunit IIA [Azospirillum sp. TSH100]PWC87521.1 transcriptional regulator [Azospirillum sp. TSH100]QCG89725.1 PTS sugar transporter subunit IIA [Azospirillum sp. TSH100]
MTITDYFSATDVILDAVAGNKASLLDQLAAEAAERSGRPAPEILEALQAREKIGSTALGRGVALPHTELADLAAPVVLFARLQRSVDFDARDDEPVDLVFLALWPASNRKGLLAAMAEICGALRDPQSLRRLRGAKTPDDAAQIVLQAVAQDEDGQDSNDATPGF